MILSSLRDVREVLLYGLDHALEFKRIRTSCDAKDDEIKILKEQFNKCQREFN